MDLKGRLRPFGSKEYNINPQTSSGATHIIRQGPHIVHVWSRPPLRNACQKAAPETGSSAVSQHGRSGPVLPSPRQRIACMRALYRRVQLYTRSRGFPHPPSPTLRVGHTQEFYQAARACISFGCDCFSLRSDNEEARVRVLCSEATL